MSFDIENLYYCLTIFLFSFVGAIVGELYETNKDNEEKPINVKTVIASGTTGAIFLIGINFVYDSEFYNVLFFSFLFGLFGWKILSLIKKTDLYIMIIKMSSGDPKKIIDVLVESEKAKNKNEDEDT